MKRAVQVDIARQQATFDDVWRRFSAEVERGAGRIDFPEGDELLPHHLTTIVRVPTQLGEVCARAIAGIKKTYTAHYYYPVEDLHFTLINLDVYFPALPSAALLADLGRQIQTGLRKLPPLQVVVKGIGFPDHDFCSSI